MSTTQPPVQESPERQDAQGPPERRHRAYVEQGPQAIYVVDAAGRFVDVNPAACRQSGHARDALLGRPFTELVTDTRTPGDFAQLSEHGSMVVRTALERADGSTLPVLVDAVRLAPDRFMAWVTDLTELVEQERVVHRERERAQAYLDTVEAIIVALDLEGRITLLNRKGCDVLGYDEDELLGTSWFATCLPQPEGLEVILPLYQRFLEGEVEAVEYLENQVLTRDGEQRDIAWHNTVLRDDEGRVIGALAAGDDITDRRRLEEHLQQTRRLEAIGTLAGGVAHDMNNVLAMILGLAEIATEGLAPDHPVQQQLQDIQIASHRGKRLVDGLLGFARRGQYDQHPLSLNDLVEALIPVLVPALPSGVRLEVDLDPGLPCVLGDDAQLSQTLLNLCLNAADAVGDAGTIRIVTRQDELDAGEIPTLVAGRYARIEVQDDGRGMTPEVCRKAFEPFFTTKDVGEGTGLGLSMVYGVVTHHRGAVFLDSAPGEGTTVLAWFPATEQPVEAEPTPAPGPPEAEAGATVLVVDDEPMLRDVLCALLESSGHQALEADGGRQAVELYREQGEDIDLVLLDLSMPDMDGGACFEALQAMDPDVAVLLCTGHADEARSEALLERGALGIARKPFGRVVLDQLVTGALADAGR